MVIDVLLLFMFFFLQKPLFYEISRQFCIRSSRKRCFVKKVFSEISQNSQENTCARVSFLINFIKKETLEVSSCEFYEISENTFFTKHLWTTALPFLCFSYCKNLPSIKTFEQFFNNWVWFCCCLFCISYAICLLFVKNIQFHFNVFFDNMQN